MIAFMIAVFGAIPFTDALIVRYVDDRMRSRVSGMRLTVAFGVSSLAVWALGPGGQGGGLRRALDRDGGDRRCGLRRCCAPADAFGAGETPRISDGERRPAPRAAR